MKYRELEHLFPLPYFTIVCSAQCTERESKNLRKFLSRGLFKKWGRGMSIGESYDYSPRVTSTHSRTIFAELEKIADNIDFRHPIFARRMKRNRSLGSAQALIVELALTDEKFQQRLKKYMVEGGKHWYPSIHYLDKY